jgi:hypothetical protein
MDGYELSRHLARRIPDQRRALRQFDLADHAAHPFALAGVPGEIGWQPARDNA